MADDKSLLQEVAWSSYDAADRPFDFLVPDVSTALICENDEASHAKIKEALDQLNYRITEPATARDALKNMRFHTYDVIVVNELFDAATPEENSILLYLRGLEMQTRRQIFVTLISSRFRTMDKMSAFNQSVNIVVNPQNIDDISLIIKGGVDDNAIFYQIFREVSIKIGRL
ncbi:MAG: hypothetical protein PHY31_10905 [Smithellaceae bacterium]|nr:hypothetical protein [Smithellaceae bacterium]